MRRLKLLDDQITRDNRPLALHAALAQHLQRRLYLRTPQLRLRLNPQRILAVRQASPDARNHRVARLQILPAENRIRRQPSVTRHAHKRQRSRLLLSVILRNYRIVGSIAHVPISIPYNTGRQYSPDGTKIRGGGGMKTTPRGVIRSGQNRRGILMPPHGMPPRPLPLWRSDQAQSASHHRGECERASGLYEVQHLYM